MKMHQTIYQYIKKNEELLTFLRYHPIWYRYLMRDPQRLHEMIQASKKFHGHTFSQRVDKFTNHMQMVHTLIQLTSAMNDE